MFLINKIFFKPKGFSLLELSVTMGLMGLVSLFTMKIMENQSMSQASIEATAEINTTISIIAQTINDPAKCNSMFYGKNINSNLNGLSYTTTPPAAATHQLLQTRASGKVYQTFFIQDAAAISLSGEPATGTANLTITFSVQPLNKSQKINLFAQNNARTIRRTIPFNVVTTGTTISSCGPIISTYSQIAKEQACNTLNNLGGGKWDWNGTNCLFTTSPSHTCSWDRLLKGFNANGDAICVPATDQVRVEDIFDLSFTTTCAYARRGYYLRVGGSGKLQLNCMSI